MAICLLALAYFMGERAVSIILLFIYLGITSDILDGIIARKQNLSTTKLRRLDSQTDMIFWLSVGFASWFLVPELLRPHLQVIFFIFFMEVLVYVISILKFGKETCTHAFLSKLWGISLLIAFTSLIAFRHAGIPFMIAIILGIISHVDRILITLILPIWTHDIPSSYHAYLIRKGKHFKRNKWLNG